jgi:hypothetical protein
MSSNRSQDNTSKRNKGGRKNQHDRREHPVSNGRCKSSFIGEKTTDESRTKIIFDTGNQIEWLIAKRKLRRKFIAKNCWDRIKRTDGPTETNTADGMRIISYNEILKLEQFLLKQDLLKRQPNAEGLSTRSRRRVKKEEKALLDSVGEKDEEEFEDEKSEEQLMLELQCEIRAQEKFNNLKEKQLKQID